MQKWFGTVLVVVVVGILIGTVIIPAVAQGGGGEAEVPTSISYQGYLTDSGGTPIEDPVNITFTLYTELSGGTPVWSEVHSGVNPDNGLFSVELGGNGSPMLANVLDGDRFLGVQLGVDPEMTPRQKVTSVPYALVAETANTAAVANTAYTLSAPDGDPADAVYVDNDGKVGIGTGTPNAELEIGPTIPTKVKSSQPVIVGSCDTSVSSWGVYVSGKYAYVADDDAGLKIIDISDPTSPTVVGSCSTPNIARGVYVSGKYAYVTNYVAGLQVIDISDPSSPTITGTCDTQSARGVYVSGEYAYIADGPEGLQVIDISDPTSPTIVGSCDTGWAEGVYVSGKYAYVANGGAGLKVIDISDPGSPTVVGTCDTIWANGVYVSGKYAYVADSNKGLRVIDISDPTSPTIVGIRDTPDYAYGVYVSGKYAYVADWDAGLQVIDISGIDTPAISTGNISTSDITVTENADIGNNLYVRNAVNVGPGGLYVDEGNGITTDGDLIALGNAGIGTIAPSTKLEVVGTITGDGLAIDGSVSGSGFSGWDTVSSNDLTITTSFSGDVTGIWSNMQVGNDSHSHGNATVADNISINNSRLYAPAGAGNVGVGLTNPIANLDIAGGRGGIDTLRLLSGVRSDEYDSNQILFSYENTNNYTHAIKSRHHGSQDAGNAIDFYVWDYGTDSGTETGTMQVMSLNGGNVGIGTTEPTSKLQVEGYIQLDTIISAPPTADCDDPSEYGRMIYNHITDTCYICSVTGWKLH